MVGMLKNLHKARRSNSTKDDLTYKVDLKFTKVIYKAVFRSQHLEI